MISKENRGKRCPRSVMFWSQDSRENSWSDERREMVRSQIAARGIRDSRVLAAMETVPREEFVPPDMRNRACDDGPLPIGHQQTISQPLTVAFMAEALQLMGDEKVLEIGTGSGYGAAVLSRLAKEIHTIERLEDLASAARKRLARLGYSNVWVHRGDGTLGLPEYAPYDAICVTASPETLPEAYQGQLTEGGRLVIPVGDLHYGQQMMRYTKNGGELLRENLGEFSFVPLIGKFGHA